MRRRSAAGQRLATIGWRSTERSRCTSTSSTCSSPSCACSAGGGKPAFVAQDRAAFFDVDGTLVDTNVVDAYLHYVLNRGTILGTAARLVKGLAMAPLYAAADLYNRKVFNELFYRAYRGLSEDRLLDLADSLCDDVLEPAVYPGARDIIAEARRGGCRIVLCTGAIDITMRPLARRLGADDLIANSL